MRIIYLKEFYRKYLRRFFKREAFVLQLIILAMVIGFFIGQALASDDNKKEQVISRNKPIITKPTVPTTTTTTTTVPEVSSTTTTVVNQNTTLPAQTEPPRQVTPTGDCHTWMQGIIPEDQQDAAYQILMKESGCNYRAQNPRSSAYGLCQTMLSVHKPGESFMHDPIEQMQWCNTYAQNRYNGWHGALEFWNRNKWW
jgi:hypothetical protein